MSVISAIFYCFLIVISLTVIYMYFHKYIKYKSRYTDLKNTMNGGSDISRDKVLGSLYGLAVGDAVGARYEFLYADEAKIMLGNDIKNNYLPILGEGPFKIEKGQVTDDSEMMISLLNAISSVKRYDQEIVAQNYIKWFNTSPPDIGNTIRKALFTRKRSISAKNMVENSIEMNCTSLSNGLLMRIAPLGLLSAINPDINLKKIVKLEGDLTHPNKLNKATAYIYCEAIKLALKGYDKKIIFDKILMLAKKYARLRIILNDSIKAPEPTYVIDETRKELYINTDDKKYQGYLGIALQNTFYELLNNDSYEESIINIIKRGGDTDTNCAIAGALLGAYYGYSKIDPRWIKEINNATVKRYEEFPFLSPKMINKNIDLLIPKS